MKIPSKSGIRDQFHGWKAYEYIAENKTSESGTPFRKGA